MSHRDIHDPICPRCGWLPDTFFSRRISEQRQQSRRILAILLATLAAGFSATQWHMIRADLERRAIAQEMREFFVRDDARHEQMEHCR